MEVFVFSAECSICCEPFSTTDHCHAPHLLSCGHSFCLNCILRIASGSNQITCPTCREITILSNGRTTPPKNFALIDILSNARQSSSQTPSPSAPDASLMQTSTSSTVSSSSLSSSAPSTTPTPYVEQVGEEKEQRDEEKAPKIPTRQSKNLQKEEQNQQQYHSSIAFVQFAIPKENCFALAQDWIRSLWFAPSDLKFKVEIPNDFQSLLVPHWVFTASMKSKVTAVEEFTNSQGTLQRRPYSFDKSIDKKQVCVCACIDEKQRLFIDAHLQNTWDISTVCVYNPSIPPASASTTDGNDSCSTSASSNSGGGGGGIIGWFLRALTQSTNKAPIYAQLPNAQILEHSSADPIWQSVYQLLKLELENQCRNAINEANRKGNHIFGTHIAVQPATYEARLVYLPLFSEEIKFNGESFNVIINGQTGDVKGDRPYINIFSEVKKFFKSVFSSSK